MHALLWTGIGIAALVGMGIGLCAWLLMTAENEYERRMRDYE